MLTGRVHALFILGWAFVKSLVIRLFGSPRGIAQFEENYRADRLPAVTPEERETELPAFSGCIACGLCDVGEGERIARSNGAYPGLMQLILGSSRSMPDYDAAALGFAHVPEDVLRDREAICPTGVPMRRLARFVATKAQQTRLPVLTDGPARLSSARR